MLTIEKIVIIGAGNVATHLAKALHAAGKHIVQVYSRTDASARALAKQLSCGHTHRIKDLYPDADLYIFSVPDHALESLLKDFPYRHAFAAHTSGSIPLKMLSDTVYRAGVFYPLQTFSKQVQPDFSSIPICIEACDDKHTMMLEQLGRSISRDVRRISSDQRKTLHVAAVFACNFTNHMLAIASDILNRESVSFDILQPLLQETVRKVKHRPPQEVQTGPAVREDLSTIKAHLEVLSDLPGYQKLYNFISQSIMESTKRKTP